jgi:peroxiredoxin
MAQLRQDHQIFLDRDAVVIVVGPDSKEKFQAYWRENTLPFIGLPDPKHVVLKTYGQEIKLFKWGRMPAQTLIDRQGKVRLIHYGDSMSDIPKNEEILELIDQLIKEEKEKSEKDPSSNAKVSGEK